ncbi:hypothetical protein [Halomarina ordinaria]|uniref:Uncharacterized protein n=1 Tax=Halomarina ordinaria TaxID=3033939 RepID=A0ABD5U690_9EURY|nr:hypothetical protein [Halomarina sp. PSRA2]
MMQGTMDLLVPLFFVGFFAAAIVAVAFAGNRYIRGTYLAGFFTVFIAVNLFVSVIPAPVVHWHKFSDVRDQDQTHYELRVVDAEGRELQYDNKATLGANGVAMADLHREMRTERTAEGNREMGQYLLDRATRYRSSVEEERPWRFLRFPPHSTTGTWTPQRLSNYDEFVGVRLYRFNVSTSEDGQEVTDTDETLLLSYDGPSDRLAIHEPGAIEHTEGADVVEGTNAEADRESRSDDVRTPRAGRPVAAVPGPSRDARSVGGVGT